MSDEMERDEKQAGVTQDVTLPAENPPKRRAGGQPGNTNSTIHGARSKRPALALGTLGRRHKNIQEQIFAYRRMLLTQVEAERGTPTHNDLEYIIAAATFEAARRILQKDLATEEMSTADRMACLRQMAQFTQQRLQAVAKLKLDKASADRDDDDPASIYLEDDANSDPTDTTA
ncbi:MAG: hypothetical protein KJZ87_06040 [Thermoguttaceae bacterium]|nr:hypothetical protein [Thermoguttaceae bacterium]